MAGKIFISYRREDEQGFALRLYERMMESFGKERLFFDIDSIPPGFDFVKYIDNQIALSDIVLVIIGRDWLNVVDPHGRRRLDSPEDFVRIEIESALKQDKHVVPVMVQGAPIPLSKELPRKMQPLARRHAFFAPHGGSNAEFAKLVQALENTLLELDRSREAARQKALDDERRHEAVLADAALRAEQAAREAAERERLKREEAEKAQAAQLAERKALEAAEGERLEREQAERVRAAERDARETAERERLQREQDERDAAAARLAERQTEAVAEARRLRREEAERAEAALSAEREARQALEQALTGFQISEGKEAPAEALATESGRRGLEDSWAQTMEAELEAQIDTTATSPQAVESGEAEDAGTASTPGTTRNSQSETPAARRRPGTEGEPPPSNVRQARSEARRPSGPQEDGRRNTRASGGTAAVSGKVQDEQRARTTGSEPHRSGYEALSARRSIERIATSAVFAIVAGVISMFAVAFVLGGIDAIYAVLIFIFVSVLALILLLRRLP